MQFMHIVHDDIHCLITYIHAIYMLIVYTISKKEYVFIQSRISRIPCK